MSSFSEEVYDIHTDTAGNWHWTGTMTGHHKLQLKKGYEMDKYIDHKELIDKLYPIGSFFFTYLHLEEHDPNKFFKDTTWVYTGHDLSKKIWKRVR